MFLTVIGERWQFTDFLWTTCGPEAGSVDGAEVENVDDIGSPGTHVATLA